MQQPKIELRRDLIKPLPSQDIFLDAMYVYEYVLFGGAAGPGKSYILRWAFIELLMYWFQTLGLKGVRVGLFCEDYPSLKDRHVSRMQREFPKWLGEVKDTTNEGLAFYLRPEFGGGFISLRNLDDPSKYASTEFAAIGVDEITKNKRQTFDDLRFRKRWSGIEHSPFLCASNPGSVGHGWVKKLWINKDFSGDDSNLNPDNFLFIPALARENPNLPQSYWDTLHSLPESMRRAMEEGNWDMFVGQVFTEFSRTEHVTDQFDYPLNQCKKIIAFDWGYNHPASAQWLAICPENKLGVSRIYSYREIHRNKTTPEEWAQLITIFTEKEETEFMVLPHDCYSDREGKESISEILKRGIKKCRIIRGDTLSRGARVNRVALTHQGLSIAPDGKPYWQIHPKCENLIETLPVLVHDDNNPEDVAKIDGDDCLEANTLVCTNKGQIPIYKLVGKNGLVYSDKGLQEFYNARMTGIKQLYRFSFNSGKEINCTATHRFLTNNGWKFAIDLRSTDMIQIAERTGMAQKALGKKQGKNVRNYTSTQREKAHNQLCCLWPEISGRLQKSQVLFKTLYFSIFRKKVFVTKIEKLDKQKTYNLEVKNRHCYCIEGGIIVHNSYDAASLGLKTIKATWNINSGPVRSRIIKRQTPWKQTNNLIQTVDFGKMFRKKKKRSPERSIK